MLPFSFDSGNFLSFLLISSVAFIHKSNVQSPCVSIVSVLTFLICSFISLRVDKMGDSISSFILLRHACGLMIYFVKMSTCWSYSVPYCSLIFLMDYVLYQNVMTFFVFSDSAYLEIFWSDMTIATSAYFSLHLLGLSLSTLSL